MGKALILGLGATALVAAAAGAAYYVGPAHDEALATPPVLVDGPPEAALARIRAITADRYLQAIGADKSEKTRLIHLAMSPTRAGEATATLTFDQEAVLLLHVRARAAGGNRTAIDITAELPPSRFSTDQRLHPYDLKVIAAMADLMATDYVSSILKGERMLNNRELDAAMRRRIGFDRAERDAFSERVGKAVEETFGPQLERAERAAEVARWRDEQSDPYRDEARNEPMPPPDNLTGDPGTDLSRYDSH